MVHLMPDFKAAVPAVRIILAVESPESIKFALKVVAPQPFVVGVESMFDA